MTEYLPGFQPRYMAGKSQVRNGPTTTPGHGIDDNDDDDGIDFSLILILCSKSVSSSDQS